MECIITQKKIGKYMVNFIKYRKGGFGIEVYKEGLINYVLGLYVGKDFEYAVKEYYNTCEKYEREVA